MTIKPENTNVLVTGGAGFIGGETALSLRSAGYNVTIIDDLSTGCLKPYHEGMSFYEERVQNAEAVESILRAEKIHAILHFAGSIRVDESITDPLKYYENNTLGTISLLQAAEATGVKSFIFSSTAAVYGTVGDKPVGEDNDTSPLNPYGHSKLFSEKIIEDNCRREKSSMSYGIFRYFNVAGANLVHMNGQNTHQPDHLIGRTVNAVLGTGPELTVFGDNLPTPDGTGVRDYIHVTDVANAHVAMLEYLLTGGAPKTMNLGYGRGYSVKDVIDAVSRVSGKHVPFHIGAARTGEAPSVISDTTELQNTLNWTAKFDDLDDIVSSALEWAEQSKQVD